MDARWQVVITIDELVLHGFSSSDRVAIGAAFSHELERLAVELGTSAMTDADVPSASAQISLPRGGGGPSAIGAQVAKAVHGVIPK